MAKDWTPPIYVFFLSRILQSGLLKVLNIAQIGVLFIILITSIIDFILLTPLFYFLLSYLHQLMPSYNFILVTNPFPFYLYIFLTLQLGTPSLSHYSCTRLKVSVTYLFSLFYFTYHLSL